MPNVFYADISVGLGRRHRSRSLRVTTGSTLGEWGQKPCTLLWGGVCCMREMTDRKEIGCGEIHVGDCYVWAEIYYLYSPTDYREYISNPVSQRRTAVL